MQEEWKPIANFPNYAISNFGRVFDIKRRKIKKQELAPNGYLRIWLRNQGMQYRKRVHSLVLNAFSEPQPIGKECNHIDGNKKNNMIANLEYLTRKENIHHAIENGKHPFVCIGEYLSKRLDKTKVESIKKLFQSGINRQLIAEQFKISRPSVYRVATGHR